MNRHSVVGYRQLGLDAKLREEDQFLAIGDDPEDDENWQMVKPEAIGFTVRRWAAFGTRYRRPIFKEDEP